jgi:UDP-N-acetylmuramate--alanine ligase
MMRHRTKRIHMIGIGGAGMSPIAELLVNFGYVVSGSDRQPSTVTGRLESLGVKIQFDHRPDLVCTAEVVVYSSAIAAGNPERKYAETHGIIQIRRAELLGDLMRAQPTVCISGTHGKTTVTSLTGAILRQGGLDPTVLVGGMLREAKTNALIGGGGLMVAEADEYDRSFLAMFPAVAVITNIDADHLDCYRDLDDIKSAFLAFTERVPFYGDVIACSDDAGVREILPSVKANVTTYGIDAAADYRAEGVEFSGGNARFSVIEWGTTLGTVGMSIPGMHNVRNALAAIAVGRLYGMDIADIASALTAFKGVHRRFDVLGTIGGAVVVDDYAHHPRELQATISAARQSGALRVIAVFQPHLFSRTRDFLEEFAEALTGADVAFVTGIYKAREEPIPMVTAESIVVAMEQRGYRQAHYIEDWRSLPELVAPMVKSGDYLLFMGAGDIGAGACRMMEVLDGKA